jgi:CBS domain-containing protein
MRDNDIGDVLIVEGDRLRGLVTDRDLAIRVLADGNGPDTPVREVCTEEPVTVSPEDDVESALELMRAHAVRRVPVVENGMPVGMVSLGDLATTREPESVLGEISQAIPNQ